MTDLERLTERMTPQEGTACRLGYALGLLHGVDPDKIPDIALDGPEIRLLEDLDLG